MTILNRPNGGNVLYECELIRSLLQHEDNLQNSRIQWMLLTHTFLFLTVFTAASVEVPTTYLHYRSFLFIGFGIFGCLISLWAGALIQLSIIAKKKLLSLKCNGTSNQDHNNERLLKAVRKEELSPLFQIFINPVFPVAPLLTSWLVEGKMGRVESRSPIAVAVAYLFPRLSFRGA